MHDQRLAVHRTIVVVDVEGFGDQCRTNRDQLSIRDGLYRAMRDAFGRAGIPWGDCGHEDRGDGVFVLVPAEVPKGLLAELLPSALVTALRTHNGAHPDPERIRLRMALHAGEVYYDEHGVTAAAVNLAFRLLDAGALRAALASSPGVLAVIASSWFYEEVIRHSAGVSVYRPVEVAVKETTTTGWICLPDQIDPAGGAMPERPPAVAAVPGGLPAVALRTLPRDTAAFTGRTGELDQLVAAVCDTAARGVAGIYAVDGMAGIGKTAFALHAAHKLAARFPDGQIFLRLHAHTAGQRPVDPAQALQLSRDLGDRYGHADASINLGEVLFLSSAYREARGYLAQALSIARDINLPVEEARALEGIGRCHIQEGNPGQGAADLRRALEIYQRIGAPEARRRALPQLPELPSACGIG